MNQPKVFVVGRDGSVYALFHHFGWEITNTIEHADLVQFTGGEDIDPLFYNQHPHAKTYTSAGRNKLEHAAFRYAKNLKKYQAGICRGAQLLNVFCGGSMWQHVDNHQGTHDMMDTRTNLVHKTSSIHHQMMIPGVTAEVVAVAMMSTKREKMSGIDGSKALIRSEGSHLDPEVIWYAKEKCFGFQGHPEYDERGGKVATLYMEYLKEFTGLSK